MDVGWQLTLNSSLALIMANIEIRIIVSLGPNRIETTVDEMLNPSPSRQLEESNSPINLSLFSKCESISVHQNVINIRGSCKKRFGVIASSCVTDSDLHVGQSG